MRLAPFIRANADPIISEWERFAATLVPAADDMNSLSLRDHITEILEFIAGDIEAPQTGAEQISKSHGNKEQVSGHSAAETHAALRLAGGFNLDQMISEFRALRASVTKLWKAQLTNPAPVDYADLTRFNESVDQALTESVGHYSRKIAASKDLLMSILTQDLAQPLGTIRVAAGFALRIGRLHERQTMLVSEIIESAAHASVAVDQLLDLTRARLGSGLPVVRQPMDMGFVSRKLVDETRSMHPGREIKVDVSGDLEGHWDKARIGQALSNLLGNAIRYGFSDSGIGVTVTGGREEVTLSVHNEGTPIPPDALGAIFEPLNQDGEATPASVNLGLGLYITEEIVAAHGGSITVTSSEKDGTTFTARFPRLAVAPPA